MTQQIDSPANGSDAQLGLEGLAHAKAQLQTELEIQLLEDKKTEAYPPADDGLPDAE
jgi:hypothetical protein